MHAFEYHRPSSTKDALALGANKEEARYLAGGQSLVQAMKLRLSSPSDLIDLGTIKELVGIKASGSAVEIGAMTRHADVAGSKEVQKAIPALAMLAGIIGDRQVRHMGTIGGSLANSDPAADYPAAVLGLGATITTNKRKIEADKYLQGPVRDRARAGRAHHLGVVPGAQARGLHEVQEPGLALRAGRACSSPTSAAARCAWRVTGAGPCAFRQAEMEKALAAKFAPDAVANIKVKQDGLNNDLHASPEYRAHLITVMAKRAVEAALK